MRRDVQMGFYLQYATFDNIREEQALPTGAQRAGMAASRFFNSKPVVWTAYLLNGIYTVLVSLLFASFSYRRAQNDPVLGAFYAFCSLVMNAPMAWFFTESAIGVGKRFFKNKDYTFKLVTFLALVLALGTTAAGLKVAAESVDGVKKIAALAPLVENVGVATFLVGMSAFNTFCTRFVGSVFLLFTLWSAAKNFYRRHTNHYRPYYQFSDDLEHYGHIVNVEFQKDGQKTDVENLQQYVQQFYSTMYGNTEIRAKGIRPGSSWRHTLTNTAVSAVTAVIIATMTVNIMPLWIKLTVGGAETFSKLLSESLPFVLYAAISNELFYLNSARLFVPRVISFVGRAVENSKAKLDGVCNRKAKIAGVVTAGLAFMTVWSVLAYYSGTGYGEDGAEAQAAFDLAIRNGTSTAGAMDAAFGDMAGGIWSPIMGWWTSLFMPIYSSVVTTMSAGSIVNGGAALSFCLTRIPFFQEARENALVFGPQQARATLENAIEQGEIDLGVRDTIEARRNAASPRSSLWSSCRQRVGEREHLIPFELVQRNSMV